jgi:hypothetical protein
MMIMTVHGQTTTATITTARAKYLCLNQLAPIRRLLAAAIGGQEWMTMMMKIVTVGILLNARVMMNLTISLPITNLNNHPPNLPRNAYSTSRVSFT